MIIKAALAAGVLALGLSVPALAQDSDFNLSIESASLATEASAREAYDRRAGTDWQRDADPHPCRSHCRIV